MELFLLIFVGLLTLLKELVGLWKIVKRLNAKKETLLPIEAQPQPGDPKVDVEPPSRIQRIPSMLASRLGLVIVGILLALSGTSLSLMKYYSEHKDKEDPQIKAAASEEALPDGDSGDLPLPVPSPPVPRPSDKEVQDIFNRWNIANGQEKSYAWTALDGASGRYLSGSFKISVMKKPDGLPIVNITYVGKCKSNNFIIGAKGVFRIKVGSEVHGEVKADCGPRGDSSKSKTGTYTLTDNEVIQYAPQDVSLLKNYR